MAFYEDLFKQSCNLDWPGVCKEASRYTPALETLCPRYLDEMRGVADGAGVTLVDIIALNVRTEITFGLFTDQPSTPVKMDGCTALSCKDDAGTSFLAQNWDWMREQRPNLVVCHISQPGTCMPDLSMVTEAGVIGKIGLNSKGVGVCLNAIRARGVDPSKLPVHLALRTVLESPSREAAVGSLREMGVAGSAHLLVADETGSVGLEFTINGLQELPMDDQSRVIHSNHLLLDHPGVDEPPWLPDSPFRALRLRKLAEEQFSAAPVTVAGIFELFKDEDGYPGAINRCQVGESYFETLFNIVMDLSAKSAMVSFGRATEYSERVQFAF